VLRTAGQKEYADSAEAQERGDNGGEAYALLAQYQHFNDERDERERGFKDGGNARGNVLLRPEERAILGDKHQQADDEEIAPLRRGGADFALETHESEEGDTGQEEAGAGGKERRQLEDGDADGEERGSPEHIDGKESEGHAEVKARGRSGDCRVGNR